MLDFYGKEDFALDEVNARVPGTGPVQEVYSCMAIGRSIFI